MEEVADILHVPQGGLVRDPNKSNTKDFWDVIVDDELQGFASAKNKNSNIRNSVFRYIQKVLDNLVLARNEPANVRLTDLWVITCMLRDKRVNFASLLMEIYIRCRIQVYHICVG